MRGKKRNYANCLNGNNYCTFNIGWNKYFDVTWRKWNNK